MRKAPAKNKKVEDQSQDLRYETRGRIGLITLDRPGKLNAFRRQTFEELLGVLDSVKRAGELRVLVLTGAGDAFSSGQDLSEFPMQRPGEMTPEIEREARERLEQFQEITWRLVGLPQVVISAINGPAVGVGAELAVASDIRLASKEAYLAFVEARRGLFQTNGVMYFLPRLVGHGRAMEMLFTGRKVGASEALGIGLISNVTDPEALVPAAMELAETIGANAPVSLGLIKGVGRQALDVPLGEVMRLEVEGMLSCLRSEDLWEGLRAFEEKRTPSYEGR